MQKIAKPLSRPRVGRLKAPVAARIAELEHEKRTAARRAAKLVELDRARSELFANLSHELRTPLALILGSLRDFGDGRFGPLTSGGRREVGLMRANAALIEELVNQILDMARLEAGSFCLSAVRADLSAFVSRVAGRFVALAERCCLDFSIGHPGGPVWLYFDPEQLDKVLTNLLSNAFKFTPGGGRIRISVAEPDGGWVRLAVEDTGPGIPARELPRLFDRFYQVERHHPGSGLGLALARDLVELHGGTLDVRSTPGEGSTFTVNLCLGREHFGDDQIVADPQGAPDRNAVTVASQRTGLAAVEAVRRREAGTGPAPDSSSTAGGEARTTVLVVDDHPDLRAYLRRHLEDRYRVIEAADGNQGLERARRFVPDLVVTDVMMPLREGTAAAAPEAGFCLCRAIKRDPELQFIPVILLTAKASAEARLKGLGEWADDVVTKPFDIRELRARIDNLIHLRRLLRRHFLDNGGQAPAAAVTEAGNGAGDRASLLARASAIIDRRMADEDFHVEDLARHLAMSRSSLYQRLDAVGQAPAGLILERRLQRAAGLLANGAGSVAEVAFAVGFKSVSHFSQRFHRRFGTTPSAFRRGAASSA